MVLKDGSSYVVTCVILKGGSSYVVTCVIVGVFVGVTASEYQALRPSPVSQISQYTNSGKPCSQVLPR